MSARILHGALGLGVLTLSGVAGAQAPAPDLHDRPLSAAQTALFETPHLKAITHPETLEYRFERVGIDPFADTVSVHIEQIHPDGTKYVSFDFLSGEHHVFYPAVDNFSGNPLLMIFLEHDVQEMKTQIGVAATYFRNRVRDAFIDRAVMVDSTVAFGGKSVPARRITLKPFADDRRFEQLPAIQGKTYSFVLSDQVPGQIESLEVAIPADPESKAPAWSERLSFTGEKP
jgi:hypothetical protein